jgi:hypothetical protein
MKKAVSVLISVIIGLALINGLAFSAISSTREQARIAAGFDFSEQGVHGDYIYGELKGHLLSATSDYTVTFNGILGLDVIDGRITETSTTNITTGVINWLDSNGRKIATSSITFGTPVLITYPVPDISITISNSATTINRVTGNFKIYQSKNNVTEVSAAEMLAVMKQVSANIKLTNDRLDFISANILANTAQLVTLNMEYYWTVAFSVTVNNTPTSCTLTNNEIVVRVFNCGVTDTVWAETNAAAVHGKCTPIVAGPNGLYLTAGKSSDYFSIVGPNKGVWTRIEKGRKEPW